MNASLVPSVQPRHPGRFPYSPAVTRSEEIETRLSEKRASEKKPEQRVRSETACVEKQLVQPRRRRAGARGRVLCKASDEKQDPDDRTKAKSLSLFVLGLSVSECVSQRLTPSRKTPDDAAWTVGVGSHAAIRERC